MSYLSSLNADFCRVVRIPTLLLAVFLVAACAGEKERLVPMRSVVPEGIDLSGRWVMRDDIDDMSRRIQQAIRQTDGIDEKKLLKQIASRQQRGRRSSGDIGGLVHVFLENASRLKITQTVDGLFIGFNRSIVEEYQFGEARMIRTGGAVAQRVSGWEGEQYVIETLGEEGMKLTERYTLVETGRLLTREIVLRSEDLEQVAIVQTYVAEQ